MIKLKLAFVIFLLNLPRNNGQISDKRLCANEECTEKISLAKTKIKYSSPDRRILSFAPNEDVTVYSKSAGSVKDLWGVEIRGRRGYVNKDFIRESRILINDRALKYTIDTELIEVDNKEVPSIDVENVQASGVNFEIIAGTTIHLNDGAIQSTVVDNSVQPTASPQNFEISDEESSESSKETEGLDLSVGGKQTEIDSKINADVSAEKIDETESSAKNEESKLDLTTDSQNDEQSDDDDGEEDDDDDDSEDDEDEEENSSEKSESQEQMEQSQGTIKAEQSEPAVKVKVDESNVVENDVITKDETRTNLDSVVPNVNASEPNVNAGHTNVDGILPNVENEVTMKDETLQTNLRDVNEPNEVVVDNIDFGHSTKDESLNDANEENANRTSIVMENIDAFVRSRKLLGESSEEIVSERPSLQELGEKHTNEQAGDKIKEADDNMEKTDDNIKETHDKFENVNVENEMTENATSENFNLEVGAGNIIPHDIVSETASHGEILKTDDGGGAAKIEMEAEKTEVAQTEVEETEAIETQTIVEEEKLIESHPNSETAEGDAANKLREQHEQTFNEITTMNPIDDPVDILQDFSNHVTPDPMEIGRDLGANIHLDYEPLKVDDMKSDESNEEITSDDNTDENLSIEDDNLLNIGENMQMEVENSTNEIDESTGGRQADVETQSGEEDKGTNSNVFSGLSDWFGGRPQAEKVEENELDDVEEDRVIDAMSEDKHKHDFWSSIGSEGGLGHSHDDLLSRTPTDYESCPAGSINCMEDLPNVSAPNAAMDETPDVDYSYLVSLVTFLGVTGVSVVMFLFGYILIDKNRKEGPLIAKINNLEKALLIATKENHLLSDRIIEVQTDSVTENDRVSSEAYEVLQLHVEETVAAKMALEEQVQSLERELENSTEVGLELNRMLSDILSSQNASDTLIANVEQLQRQLVEQQSTINSLNANLNLKDTENHELQLEMEINNKKVTDLQTELDKMVLNLLKIEEEKDTTQGKLETELAAVKQRLDKITQSYNIEKNNLMDEVKLLKTKHADVQRTLEVKINEYTLLKDSVNQVKAVQNNTETLQILLDVSSVKAEVQQLQRENQTLNDLLLHEQQTKYAFEKQAELAIQEARLLKAKYDEADKEKLEAFTKLEVLSNYFKDKESQLQKELSKQESMWIEKHGEATSTVERIKYMQEELQNCKAQNESLKQEIVSQEVELKSQITVLEKKAHESWMLARQAERKLEDARQEAAQLRNRLTLKERNFAEEKVQNRLQSMEQNGEIPNSPLHMAVDSPASPPLLYGARDHLTTSPPMPGLPPFLPPPPGVPFMPPHMAGVPGFMPPPPSMFPVDHRPPPLGRMSSPPINSRYSPDSRYSPYDRNSPSPPYDDYGPSPPSMHRAYSPYNNRDDRRDYRRPLPPSKSRSNGKNEGAYSSGSANSNESLEKINRHHSKV